MSEYAVERDEVEHIADLARVELTSAEVERFAEQFGEILSAFEALDEVPETDREPELTNVLRPDEITESLSQEEALQNAPETEAGQFKGPKVS
jgi:aspartyl-tRNA(Asn)/glutamyl-tRNA(Gln) amidotransferase subunit C